MLALLVVGCADVPIVSYVDSAGQMDLVWLNDHTTLVSVSGSPFPGLSNESLARIIATEMPNGFTHARRYAGNFGDLLVGHISLLAQDQDLAIGGRESEDRRLHAAPRLVLSAGRESVRPRNLPTWCIPLRAIAGCSK